MVRKDTDELFKFWAAEKMDKQKAEQRLLMDGLIEGSGGRVITVEEVMSHIGCSKTTATTLLKDPRIKKFRNGGYESLVPEPEPSMEGLTAEGEMNADVIGSQARADFFELSGRRGTGGVRMGRKVQRKF